MSIYTSTVSTFAQIYAALKITENHFFESVHYDDDNSPTEIICEDADGNTVMVVESAKQVKNVIGYFSDNTYGSINSASSAIDIVGICENGVYLGTAVSNGAICSKDAYGNYAFCDFNSSNPRSYSPESLSINKNYTKTVTADDQTILDYMPIPKGSSVCNYFPNLFFASAKELTLSSVNDVTVGTTHYLCIGGRAYIKDAVSGGA